MIFQTPNPMIMFHVNLPGCTLLLGECCDAWLFSMFFCQAPLQLDVLQTRPFQMFVWWTAATLGEPFQSHAVQKWRGSFACAKAHWTVSRLFLVVTVTYSCWYWNADMFCLGGDLSSLQGSQDAISHMEHISTLLFGWWHVTIQEDSLRCFFFCHENHLRSDVCSLRTFQWLQYYHALALEGHLFQSQWACHGSCCKFSCSTCFSGWTVGLWCWVGLIWLNPFWNL